MHKASVVAPPSRGRTAGDLHGARTRVGALASQAAASVPDARQWLLRTLSDRRPALRHPTLRLTPRRRRELRFALQQATAPALTSLLALTRAPAVAARRLGATGRERRLAPVLVLSFVLVASLLAQGRSAATAVGATEGLGAGAAGRVAALGPGADVQGPGAGSDVAVDPGAIDAIGAGNAPNVFGAERGAESSGSEAGLAAPFLADGTLLKPVAVDSSVPTERTDVTIYTVQSGDTLTGIAASFNVSMMTLWWANSLSSKDELHVGQQLRVPPVSGVVYTVKEGDTLDSVAAALSADSEAIKNYNGLSSDTVIIGQQLMVPNGVGAPLPTPKPTPRPVVRPTYSGGSASGCGSCSFSGTLRWPVAGGYISQYFSYWHPALDIAGDYGTPVLAAGAGKVIWAGWRSNGGGYQIWIDHGTGMYTTYNHLSALNVGAGTYVARGQRIGAIGMSGWATGPHLHFEVWRGSVWAGGYRVNPLAYL